MATRVLLLLLAVTAAFAADTCNGTLTVTGQGSQTATPDIAKVHESPACHVAKSTVVAEGGSEELTTLGASRSLERHKHGQWLQLGSCVSPALQVFLNVQSTKSSAAEARDEAATVSGVLLGLPSYWEPAPPPGFLERWHFSTAISCANACRPSCCL